jgi:hypothetical protein
MTISKAYLCVTRRAANGGGRGPNIAPWTKQLRWSAAIVLACFGLILLARCGKSQAVGITIEIQPNTTQTIDASQIGPPAVPQIINFTAAVGGDTTNSGVTWNLTVLSTGCSGTGCGTLINPMPFSVTYVAPSNIATELTGVMLQAVSKANTNATASITINIVLDPTFTTASLQQCAIAGVFCLPNGSNGVTYNSQSAIAATGGVSPYTFRITSGTLPPGLTLNPGNAAIVGKPTSPTAGNPAITFVFTVQVTDSSATPVSVSQMFQITITPPPILSITTTSLPPGTVNASYSTQIATTGGVTPLTFTITPNGLPPGLTFNAASGRIIGIPKSTGTFNFSVQVEDSSLPFPGQVVSSVPLSITINTPAPLNITTNPTLPGGFVATPYAPQPLNVAGGVAPYTWVVITGQLPAGLTLAPDGTISGTPVLATNPSPDFFTVKVSDSELDPNTGQPAPQTLTQTFNVTITVGAANPDTLLAGQYTFLFNGFDKSGPVTIIGSMTSDDNGDLTGEEDIYRDGVTIAQAPVAGIYSIGTDGRGTMRLVASNRISGALLITDYRIVLDSGGGSGRPNAHFFEDNTTNTNNDSPNGTSGEGIMKPVSAVGFTDTSFGGNYAFGFAGYESTGKLPVGLVGVVHADATVGTPSLTGMCDFNDAGAYSSQSLSGTFSTMVDSFGRSTAEFDFAQPGKSQLALHFVFYFVSPNDIFYMENDTSATESVFFLLSGEMLLQQPGYQFSTAAFLPSAGPPATSGVSVATGTGLSGSNASVFAGLLSGAIVGPQFTATLAYDENNGGTPASPSFTGTYSVANNGRAAFAGLGASAATTRLAAAYLTGPGQGFLIGSDTAVTTGLLELQTSVSPFVSSSLQGGYTLATAVPQESQVTNVIGQVYSNGGEFGSPSVSGIVDEYNPPSIAHPEGLLNLGQSLSSPYTVTVGGAGRGTLGPNAVTGFPNSLIFYIVSPASFRAISADATPGKGHPTVYFFTH